MNPRSLMEFMAWSSVSMELLVTCTFLQVVDMEIPSWLARYSPQGDHKCISLQHSELQRGFSIGKVRYPDPTFSSFANCIVSAMPRRDTIGKFPDILCRLGATP